MQNFFLLKSLESSLKWNWLLEAGYQEEAEGGGKAVMFNLENPLGQEEKELLNESADHQTQGSPTALAAGLFRV